MVNGSEPLINVVSDDKRKRLDGLRKRLKRLDQKGKGSGIGAPNSPIADGAPSAERRDLTHAGTCTERGKPIVLPWESEPQGEPMGLWVEDDGGSEGPALGRPGQVPPCNEVDRGCASIRQHHPTRKRADFHLVLRHEKSDGDAETGVRRQGSSRSSYWREPALSGGLA